MSLAITPTYIFVWTYKCMQTHKKSHKSHCWYVMYIISIMKISNNSFPWKVRKFFYQEKMSKCMITIFFFSKRLSAETSYLLLISHDYLFITYDIKVIGKDKSLSIVSTSGEEINLVKMSYPIWKISRMFLYVSRTIF